ncbi:MAG TPA: CRTAC1 family protein [Chthonomonadaceae bacterium]|nr:CRTAC1 family protein [Chthonomonadaceae bacterium]
MKYALWTERKTGKAICRLRWRRCLPALSALPAILSLAGCTPKVRQELGASTPAAAAVRPSRKPGAFVDVTEKAGIRFAYSNGAAGKYLMVETTPGGCAFLDYNQDGFQDIFLVQTGPTPDSPANTPRPPCQLFKNNGDGTFRDVTHEAGLDKLNQGYAQCVAVGDYDNDGYPDLYITAYGGNHLLHNELGKREQETGKGEDALHPTPYTLHPLFKDVTRQAGVGDADQGVRWATSAAWGDYDRDGKLDLLVLHYAPWNLGMNRKCINGKGHLTYCSPEVYTDDRPRLYHNDGNGHFTDVSAQMGLNKVHGRGLGVVWLDYDQDGWPDLYVACDITPNLLLHSRQGKRFEEVGLSAGVAYGTNGSLFSGMGIAAGDFDNKGWESLVVTNYSGQPNSVYRAVGGGRFEDATFPCGIGEASLNFLAWGVEGLDYDNDGWLDLVVGNGHVDPYIADVAQNVTYPERKLLFRNLGNGMFRDQVEDLGDLAEERITRGLAVGDFDNDGRVDILDNSHEMPARLYRNVTKGGNFATFRLEGVQSNRDAAGALVWVTAGGRRRLAEVRDGSSYGSTSDRRLHYGLGNAARIDKVEVRWPSGRRQTFANLAPNKFYYLREGGSLQPDPQVK